MKIQKFLWSTMTLVGMLLLVSCSKQNPKEIVTSFYTSAQEQNWKKLLDYLNTDSISEISSQDKTSFESVVKQALKEHSPIFNVDILECPEECLDSICSFRVKITYENGKSTDEEGVLKKTPKGDWAISVQLDSIPVIFGPPSILDVARLGLVQLWASKNNPNAQMLLSKYYGKGVIVEKDSVESTKQMGYAAKQNHVPAMAPYGYMLLTGQGITKNEKEGIKYIKQGAENNDVGALGMLGRCYVDGTGVEVDYEKALTYLKPAADKDNEDAIFLLGWMYNTGNGVPKNYNKASMFYSLAAEKGKKIAYLNLALMYLYGDGIKQDHKKARELLELAVDEDDPISDALFFLGLLYYNGEGGSKDLEKAYGYLKKAADKGNAYAINALKYFHF